MKVKQLLSQSEDTLIAFVTYLLTVGGVAQWLGRQSLADRLSRIYGQHVTTSWVKCPLWVTQPSQLSLSSLRGQ